MKKAIKLAVIALLLLFITTVYAGGDGQQFANMGEFRLENGDSIQGLKLGYRTTGELNSEKTNAVVIPAWFMGTSAEIIETQMAGPGGVVDSSKYFIVAIDPIGNGVSTSPSNWNKSQGPEFPVISIRDMSNAVYHLAVKHLGLPCVHAVVGFSMGGFQALDLVTRKPDFARKAVVISGTPRPAMQDLLVWETELRAIEATKGLPNGGRLAMKIVSPFHTAILRTPSNVEELAGGAKLIDFLNNIDRILADYDASNWSAQLTAIKNHDIYGFFDGNKKLTVEALRAQLLIVTSLEDRAVFPGPMIEFARLAGAETAELEGRCGHLAFFCEHEKVRGVVSAFLEKQ